MLSKLLSAKALAAVALGTASIGTAAAATGTLPDTAQAAAHRLVNAVPDAGRAADAAAGAGAAAAAKASAADHSAAGVVGLCQAYGSGQGGEKGGKLDAAAFQRLVEAAGDADNVATYCAKVTAATSRAAASSRAASDQDLAGACRAWLAAEQAGSVSTLGKPVLDRLASAAGAADSVATYCATLVDQAPANPRPETTPAHPTGAPGTDTPASGSSPSHPAPPTPRG